MVRAGFARAIHSTVGRDECDVGLRVADVYRRANPNIYELVEGNRV